MVLHLPFLYCIATNIYKYLEGNPNKRQK